MTETSGRPGCFTWFLAGCGCLVLLVLLGLGAVAMNLDRILESAPAKKMRQAVRAVSEEVQETMEVQQALAAKFPEDHVVVKVHYQYPGKRKFLAILMAREAAEIPEARELEDKARQAARVARDAYARPETLEGIIVRLEWTRTGKISSRLSQDYTFPMEALEEP